MPTLIETVRVRNGEAPLWGLHLRRLFRSCKALGVRPPLELEVPGGGRDRVHRLEVGPAGTSVSERPPGPTAPVRLVTSGVVHAPYPHKTADRAQFEQVLQEASELGVDDGLMLAPGGYVAEAAIWSVFWWDHDRLCAPALALGVLPGVARERISELTRIEEHRTRRRHLDGKAVVVANAARGIVEVAELDGVAVPHDEGTVRLQARFWG